jgi:chromosome segregation ATPase
MATNGELSKEFESLNKRIDTLTEEVVDVKGELRLHGDLLRAMQQTQQEMVKNIVQLNTRVDRLEQGQERLITLVARIVDRLTDFEAGAKVELENVVFDERSRTLTGTIKRIAK